MSTRNGHGRKNVDESLIGLLVTGTTYAEAALLVGCSKATVSRRMSSPDFRDRVDAERAELSASLRAKVVDAAQAGVSTLASLAVNGESESVRVAAASKLVDLALARKHRAGISERDLVHIVSRVYDIATRHIAQERLTSFATAVDAFLATGSAM
jgi:hypothetical protein